MIIGVLGTRLPARSQCTLLRQTKQKHYVTVFTRAEWKHTFLEIAKGPHGLWSTSQHWFQNNWRNHYRMNILLRNQENSFYRECKLQHSPISSNLFDEWDFCKHSHSQCCDAVQNHLESFKMLTLGPFRYPQGSQKGPFELSGRN